MKFYATDPTFFSDVSDELNQESQSVSVGHLKFLEASQDSIKSEWIVVEDSLDPRDLVAAVFNKSISHFVQKNQGHFAQDLKKAGALVETPIHYFQSGYSFMESDHVQSIQIFFSKPEEKAEMLSKVIEFIDPIKSTSAKEAAISAIEELYMNAMIDAPKESRRLGLTDANTRCELFLCFNQNTLQISCTDSFGSLDLKKLFGRLDEVYRRGPGQAINLEGTGGAGIGCFLLFEQCRTLVFGVVKGKQTKVTGLIPINLSSRERAKIKKSLHGFEVEQCD
jgi:hypothetical protein